MDENLNNLPVDGEEDIIEEVAELEEETTNMMDYEEDKEEYIPEWVNDNGMAGTAVTMSAEDIDAVNEETRNVKVTAKKSNGRLVAVIIAVVVIVALIIGLVFKLTLNSNPYNKLGYVNPSGRTIGELVSVMGYGTLDEFLAEFSLPADMPADTEESAAYYSIPVKKIVEMYGYGSIDELRAVCGFGEDVTEDTTWGEAEGQIPLKNRVSEDNLEAFKQQYGLGDDVTLETKWGEIRNIVEQKELEMRLEQEKAMAEAEAAEDESAAEADGEAAAE